MLPELLSSGDARCLPRHDVLLDHRTAPSAVWHGTPLDAELAAAIKNCSAADFTSRSEVALPLRYAASTLAKRAFFCFSLMPRSEKLNRETTRSHVHTHWGLFHAPPACGRRSARLWSGVGWRKKGERSHGPKCCQLETFFENYERPNKLPTFTFTCSTSAGISTLARLPCRVHDVSSELW